METFTNTKQSFKVQQRTNNTWTDLHLPFNIRSLAQAFLAEYLDLHSEIRNTEYRIISLIETINTITTPLKHLEV